MPRQSETIDPPAKFELFVRTSRRKLDTPGRIASEQGRIYRAAAAGRIDTVEALRLSAILKELRVSQEAAQAAAIVEGETAPMGANVIVLEVPRGTLVVSDSPLVFQYADGTTVTASELKPSVPYVPTQDWTRALAPPVARPELAEPLPVHEIDLSNVTVLHRRDGDDGPDAA